MADNTELASGSGGDTLRTEDRGTYKTPVSVIDVGGSSSEALIGDGSNTMPVSGTVTAELSSTDNTVLDNIDTNTTGLAGCVDGTELQVDIAASVALDASAATVTVDNGGTFAVQVDGAALTALQKIDDPVSGNEMLIAGGATQTNDVKVTLDGEAVSLSATDNTVLDNIDTNTDYGANTGGGTESGVLRVTIANDSTGLVSVDDNGGSLTVDGTVTAELSATDNTVLDNIDTNTSGLNGCVDGTELQVDVVASLPAGTNAIGKLAANDGVDIGDVDVTSISAGTNVIGQTIASGQSDTLYDGTTSCTIKRASGLASSGTVAMVAAVAGKKIRVLALFLKATSATVTNVYIANDDNDIIGDTSNPIPLAVDADGDNDSGFVLPWNPGGWFETDTANEDLNVVLSAAQDVIYALTYIEVD